MSGTGPRYNRRPDRNQKTLLEQAAGVPGLKVENVSHHAGLGYDAIARYQDGPPMALEIKDPADPAPLTVSEKKMRAFLGDYWRQVTTIEDVLRALGISTEPAPESW